MKGPLPLGLDPCSGESLASYLERLAAVYDVPLGVLLRRVDIQDGGLGALIGYGSVMPVQRVTALGDVLGLRAETISKMLLTTYVGGAIPVILDTVDPASAMKRLAGHWAYLYSSHFCPQCLEETAGAWQLRWRLPWSFACVAHSCLLVDRCPGCGHRPASGGPYSKPPHFIERVPIPGRCSNRQKLDPSGRRPPRRPCGCDLRAVSATRLTAWPAMTAAQEVLDRHLNDIGSDTATWFLDLRALATLLMLYPEPGDFRPAPRAALQALQEHFDHRDAIWAEAARHRAAGVRPRRLRMYQTVPTSTSLLAAVLTMAVQMLSPTTADGVAENLVWLASRMREHHRSPANVPHSYKVSDTLASAFAVASAQTGSFSLRVGLHPRRPREEAGHRVALGARHVPQLLWRDEYETRFLDLFQPLDPTQAQAFCALCLVKLLDSTSWEQAATLLDLHGAHQALVYRCQRWLSAHQSEDDFRSRLRRLAMEMAARRPLIDYASRRRAFADLREVPEELWDSICQEAGLRRTRSGGRRRYSAAWMWAELTCGDPYRSPALLGATPAVRQGWARFAARDLSRLEPVLGAAARDLLAGDR